MSKTNEIPFTFTAPSFAILDVDQNAVITTQWGNLAIFNVKAVAEQVVKQSRRNLKIVAVMITPVTEQ